MNWKSVDREQKKHRLPVLLTSIGVEKHAVAPVSWGDPRPHGSDQWMGSRNLHRNAYGTARDMDRFSYHYTTGTNRLDHVTDDGSVPRKFGHGTQ